jgi:2-polyprenyl-3-methyl-5-hydroxy-6-metoxy-1,4-benzoquinol methylase
MIDLSVRSNVLEEMDDLSSPVDQVMQNLRELEVINNRLGGYSPVLSVLDKLVTDKPVTIVDIGSGAGDMLRAIQQWAIAKRKNVNLVGIDYNPVMVGYATWHSAGRNIAYKQWNVYDDTVLNENADIVTCSLFLHHFTHEEAVDLLKRMYKIANRAVIINDLHRHWFAYYGIKLLTNLFSKTYMVKNDAPLSVARAFRRKDWMHLLQAAGISHYTIKWCWAWRWQVVLHKTNN